MAKKKAFGRQISNWKAEARAANPGASPDDLATIINEMAKKQGFAYTITADKLQTKLRRKRGRKARSATPASNGVSSPTMSDGQLLDDLRQFVHLVGKPAAKVLLIEMIDRV